MRSAKLVALLTALLASLFASSSDQPASASRVHIVPLDVPGPPSALTASVSGSTVMLVWMAPSTGDSPHSYVVEAGSGPGGSDIAIFDTGSLSSALTATDVPAGTYFVRIRARGASGIGAHSNEVRVSVVFGPCRRAPEWPSELNANVDGTAVSLSWREPQSGDPFLSYVLEAGSAPGLSNVAVVDTGNTARWFTATAPPGTYHVRVRAKNNCGASIPTNEVTVVSGATIPENVLLLISDLAGNRLVRVTDLAGSNWETGPSGSGRSLNAPWHVALDSRRRIYVADRDNNRIVRMDDLAGNGWTTFSGTGTNPLAAPGCAGTSNPPIGCVVSVTLDAADRIYIIASGRIIRIDDMSGAGWTSFGITNSGPGSFNNPKTVAFDPQGRIYVADTDRHRIDRFDDMQGTGWTTFGSPGTGVGQFNRPEGIAVDSFGRIYVTDNENHRIVRINDMTGAGWVAFGSYGTGVGNLIEPHDLAVSASMRIYIADTGNGRILRIDDMDGAGWRTFGALKRQPFGCPTATVCELPGMFEFIAIKGLRLIPRP